MLKEIIESMGWRVYDLRTKKFIDHERNKPKPKAITAQYDILDRIEYKYGKGSLGVATKEYKTPFVVTSTDIAMRSRFNHIVDYLVFGSRKEAQAYIDSQRQDYVQTLAVATADEFLKGGKIGKPA